MSKQRVKRAVEFIRWLIIAHQTGVPLRTVFWNEHPDGYDEACLCRDCRELVES